MTAEPLVESEIIRRLVDRYRNLMRQEQNAREQREQGAIELAKALRRLGLKSVRIPVGPTIAAVVDRSRIQVQYDEDILRNRLQDRYASILGLDFRKLVRNRKGAEKALSR